MWQDWVFAIGTVILGASVIPMLRDKQKPPIMTAVMTTVVLVVFVVVEWTVDLKIAAAVTVFQVIGWAALGVQRWKQANSQWWR